MKSLLIRLDTQILNQFCLMITYGIIDTLCNMKLDDQGSSLFGKNI